VLALVQNFSGAAVLCLELQNILASDGGDRTLKNGCATGALADAAGHVGSEPLIAGVAHEEKRVLNPLV
jgi:hypothetical protein